MIRAARVVAAVVLIGGLLGLAVPAPGQSSLNQVAKEELSQRAGIPLDLLATMFVTDGPDQFILAFVATNEVVLDSDLDQELKNGIRPFLDTPALLTLVYPTQASRFDPRQITFSQDGARFLSHASDRHPLTANFRPGRLPAETLSAGVIELPGQLDDSSPYQIVFRGAFETTFRPRATDSTPRSRGQTTALVRQDGRSWTLSPLQTSSSLEEIYRYENFRSEGPLVRQDASVLFLHEGSDGTLSLVAIHQARQPTEVRFTLWGLPTGATFALQDDPDDAYWLAPPSAKATWRWSSGKTDGAALNGLTDGTSLSIRPEFNGSVATWYLVRGSPDDPSYVELPSMTSPLQLVISRVGSASSESDSEGESSTDNPSDDENGLSVEIAINAAQPTVGETVTFHARASGASSHAITEYAWDLDGDGQFDDRTDQPATTHTYRSAGTYRVTLRVADEGDQTATASRTIDVQQAPAPATVKRVIGAYLPNSQALPGTSFHVRLVVEVHQRTVGLGIREHFPDGWRLTPVENAGAEFNRELTEWLFTDPLNAGETRTILYRVDVPDRAKPATVRFSGQAFSGVPSMETDLSGDRLAEIVLALPIKVAVSRLDENGALDLRLSNFIAFDQMLQATALWKDQRTVPGTDGHAIDLPTMVTLVAYWRTGTSVDRPLPTDVR